MTLVGFSLFQTLRLSAEGSLVGERKKMGMGGYINLMSIRSCLKTVQHNSYGG